MIKLTPDQIEKLNEQTIKTTDDEYKLFRNELRKGKCYLCNGKIDIFLINSPCAHWLLYPQGFKKKHFQLVFQKYDYWRINPFLRWMANTESPLKNINDLLEEKQSSKKIEQTIRYKNLEWSFSCSENDFLGKKHGDRFNRPHYHFQMKVDNNIFIKYRDFHIPFSDYDMWVFVVKKGRIPQLQHIERYDLGMQGAVEKFTPNVLLEGLSATNEESRATWNIQTAVEALPGTTISGDEIVKLLEMRKKTKIPFAKLARKLKNVKVGVVIQPGDGVPIIASRHGRRKRKVETSIETQSKEND